MAVSRIIGAVQINDQNLPGAGVGREIQFQQGLGKSVEFSGSDTIFKAGQGRLRGQISTAFRQPLCHGFEGRVLGQKSSIVGILVTQGNGKEALFQEGR